MIKHDHGRLPYLFYRRRRFPGGHPVSGRGSGRMIVETEHNSTFFRLRIPIFFAFFGKYAILPVTEHSYSV